jgi:hypothetical protein
MMAKDEMPSKKGFHLTQVIKTIIDINRDLDTAAENTALRLAFQNAVSQGVISHDALPAALLGTALHDEFPDPISDQ